MYGLGYGLGKMMEGASAGAVKGTLQNMTMDQQNKDRQSLQTYRDKTLDQGQQRIDSQEDQAKVQRNANAFKIAYDIAEKSPDPQTTFSTVYQSLNPEGDAPTVTFGEKEITITGPEYEITGSKSHLRQALDIISKNPAISPQVLAKLNELGLAKITATEKKDDSKGYGTLSEGQGVFNKDTGTIVTPATGSPEGSDFEKAYQQYAKTPGNEKKTRAEFKTEVWSKSQAAGELSDNSVLQNIRELASFDATKTSTMWDQYLAHRNEGLSRADALNKVQKKAAEEAGPVNKIVRTGIVDGKKVIKYDDGSMTVDGRKVVQSKDGLMNYAD